MDMDGRIKCSQSTQQSWNLTRNSWFCFFVRMTAADSLTGSRAIAASWLAGGNVFLFGGQANSNLNSTCEVHASKNNLTCSCPDGIYNDLWSKPLYSFLLESSN